MVQHLNLYFLYVDGSPCFCLMSELVPNTLSVLFLQYLVFVLQPNIVLILNFSIFNRHSSQPLKGTGFSGGGDIKNIESKTIKIVHFDKNVGHGAGIRYGIENIQTEYILLIDSDSYFIANGLIEQMMCQMDKETYGVGWILNYENIKYMHPSCILLNRSVALQWPMPINDGAPMIQTMIEINNKNIKILKNFQNKDLYLFHEGKGTGGEGSWPKRQKTKTILLNKKSKQCQIVFHFLNLNLNLI